MTVVEPTHRQQDQLRDRLRDRLRGRLRGRLRDGQPGSLRLRVAVTAGAVATGLAGLGYLRTADPHDANVPMPVCPWKAVTGLDCPGCGGLRMTHDLLHGELAAAFADNAVLLVLAPLLLWLLARATVRFVAGRPVSPRGRYEMRGPLGWVLVATAIGWALVRNLWG